jgi:putative transposase
VSTASAQRRFICEAFHISQTCYRYCAKLSSQNNEIADWLVRLTNNQRNWGFGLCFLYLRNVKNFGWNHKRVYRIYRELELHLRIQPKKRLAREKPEPLTVPNAINAVWSMDFMHDQLSDGRSIRLFNVIGCGPIITNGPTWPLAASPRNRNWPWPLSFYFYARLKMGGLPLNLRS